MKRIHLKGDVTDGSVLNGIKQPILYSFVLSKPLGCKIFRESETIHYEKINKSVLKTIAFYLEDDNHKEVNIIVGILTFTSEIIKVWTVKGVFKELK